MFLVTLSLLHYFLLIIVESMLTFWCGSLCYSQDWRFGFYCASAYSVTGLYRVLRFGSLSWIKRMFAAAAASARSRLRAPGLLLPSASARAVALLRSYDRPPNLLFRISTNTNPTTAVGGGGRCLLHTNGNRNFRRALVTAFLSESPSSSSSSSSSSPPPGRAAKPYSLHHPVSDWLSYF